MNTQFLYCLLVPAFVYQSQLGKKKMVFLIIANKVLAKLWLSISSIGHIHKIRVSDVLVPGQKWVNQENQEKIMIEDVSKDNATFAAFHLTTSFPIRGEFDPTGTTIGWVMSYWYKASRNDHMMGAWAGFVEKAEEKTVIVATRLISNGNLADTKIGFDRFMLEE